MKSKIENLKSKALIGCQGWNYADWATKAAGETVFYPQGTRSNEMLEIYAKAFETVEVDSTFYAVPKEETLDNWRKKTPADFTFSLKMPGDITHEGGLQKASFPVLDEFCERATLLKEKLGAVLIQLPPQFEATEENVRTFLEFLPRLPTDVQFAVEFRARNWLRGETLEILKKHGVALCLTDGAWLPRDFVFEAAKVQTADFFYVRFMGERDLTAFDRVQRAQDAALWLWHEVLSDLKAPTFVYFSNFYEGFAPASANKLKRMFRQETIEFSELDDQPSLF